ncbi:MAG: hypothetical protein MNPFHGCM_01415 [Gemmatimonadaceae bacterium]|nr:hypothetical protein [Gemmatimonadaceae bacterium]
MIGISAGSRSAPEPRVTAFVWSDEQDLEQVLADVRSAA